MSSPETPHALTTEKSREAAVDRMIPRPDPTGVSHGHFNAITTGAWNLIFIEAREARSEQRTAASKT